MNSRAHLVIAHQTALSPELIDYLQTMQAEDPEAAFVLVVPATPPSEFLHPPRDAGAPAAHGRPQDNREGVATVAAADAEKALRLAGIAVLEARVGDGLPLKAIDIELRSGRHVYSSVLLSTLPAESSRWLGMDLVRQVQHRAHGLPVRHVIASAPPATGAAGTPTPSSMEEPPRSSVDVEGVAQTGASIKEEAPGPRIAG